MKKPWLYLAITLVTALVLFSGCRSPRRSEPLAGPRPSADPALAAGRTVFQQHCHQCHPGGEGGLGPSLDDKPAPGFAIKAQVRLGLGTMPAFGRDRISDDELDQLVSYMIASRRMH